MIRSRTEIAIPPGATIKEQLMDRGMSQKEFSIRMNLSEKHISKLINGEVQLTQEVAFRLEMVLGVPAKFWNNLEAIYREKLLRIEAEKAMEHEKSIALRFPYSDMVSKGWIAEADVENDMVTRLRKYFEVVQLSLLDNSQLMRIAYRRLDMSEKSDLEMLAWVQKVKLVARDMDTGSYNEKLLLKRLGLLRETISNEPGNCVDKIKKLLSDCGIALVLLDYLSESSLKGVTFIDGKKVVIGLTECEDFNDEFWFSLFHEIGHVVLGHLNKSGGTTEDDEKEADEWARTFAAKCK